MPTLRTILLRALLALTLSGLPASALTLPDSLVVAPRHTAVLRPSGGTAPFAWRLVENRSGGRIGAGAATAATSATSGTATTTGTSSATGLYAAGLLDFVTDVAEVTDARGDTARIRILVSPGFSIEPYIVSTRTASSRTFRVLPAGTPVRFRLDPLSGSGGRISETGVYLSGLRADTVDWVLAEDSAGRVSLAQVEILSDDTSGRRIPQVRRLAWFGRVFELLFGTAPTRADYHAFLADVNGGASRETVVAGWLGDERLISLSTGGAWRGLTGTPALPATRLELSALYHEGGMGSVLARIFADTAFWRRAAATNPSDSASAWVTRVYLELAGSPPSPATLQALAGRARRGESRDAIVREVMADAAVRGPLARRVINPFLGLPRNATPPERLAAPFIAGGSFESATVAALCSPEFMGADPLP